ncbi:hypothetical protein ACU8MZ_002060 [Salmonella enterica subsp. enterica serovar Bareilly]
MKENQITASMAKDIAFKLGAVLNDEEAEILPMAITPPCFRVANL